jgi:uncharacterized protein
MAHPVPHPRVAELISQLQLLPHPEGGHFREFFRAPQVVSASGGRPPRNALTSIDFLLPAGEFSAWHRVRSDEVWHLLEGGPVRLWCMPPTLSCVTQVDIGRVGPGKVCPRHVVPADWWQAAEPLGDYAYVGATVAPGFDFADFSFARDDEKVAAALRTQRPDLLRLLAPQR